MTANLLKEYEGVPVQRSQGPFEILDASDFRVVNTVRWSDVAGSNIMVTLNTNITSVLAGVTANGWVSAEVEVRASASGQVTTIKRAQINRYTGPLHYHVHQDEPWDDILIACRNFTGGSKGVNNGSPVNNAAGANMQIMVYYQPRLIGEFAHGKLSRKGQ